MRDGTLFPVTRRRTTGARRGAAATGHDGMDFFGRALLNACMGEDGEIWIWILVSLIGKLFAQLGGKT